MQAGSWLQVPTPSQPPAHPS